MRRSMDILLVEDDDVDAEAFARALKRAERKNALFRARDGVEALDVLRAPGRIGQPCIIVLDINMPRMNGIQFLEELRRANLPGRNSVFMLTTSELSDDRRALLDFSVDGYVLKRDLGRFFEAL